MSNLLHCHAINMTLQWHNDIITLTDVSPLLRALSPLIPSLQDALESSQCQVGGPSSQLEGWQVGPPLGEPVCDMEPSGPWHKS
jgi:hypothetical protein